jgi:WD40 repeat protein
MAIATASVIIVLLGAQWYESRLQTERGLYQQRDNKIRAQETANLRRLQYVSDIRQADKLVRSFQAPLAMEILERHRPQAGQDDLREFSWYYLARRADTATHTLRGHQDQVYDVEFSPRGDLLSSSGKDGTVVIWDTSTW